MDITLSTVGISMSESAALPDGVKYPHIRLFGGLNSKNTKKIKIIYTKIGHR